MAKTEVTTVKTRTNANELIRNAVDAQKYDEYRTQWEKATALDPNKPISLDFLTNPNKE